MYLHKEYVQHNGQTIKFVVSFTKERRNWATSQQFEPGYRVTVLPVKITNHDGYSMEESGCFTGFNDTLLAIGRQSTKRLAQALVVLQERKDTYLSKF